MDKISRRKFLGLSERELDRAEPKTVPGGEKITHQGKLFEVVSEQVEIEGKTLTFEKVRRSPGVRLIMSDGHGNILLTREFRHELSKVDYRLPGGKVFDSLGEFNEFKKSGGDVLEKSKQAALKEAGEETGFAPERVDYLSTSKLGATVEWDLHYFAAPVDRSKQGAQALELGENIEVVWVNEQEAEKLALDPEQFSEERSVAALMRYLRRPKVGPEVTHPDEGARLRDLLESSDLTSIRLRSKNLEKLGKISNIIFVGSSLSGKTTLVDALRTAMKTDDALDTAFQVPKRVITRPQRANDNLVENQFVTADEFEALVQSGEIGMHWIRKMEEGREERYGFLGIDKHRVPVFSGNNAIVDNKESVVPSDLLEKSLIVAIYCPDDVRDERMQQRSPDLVREKPQEVSYRLSDRSINMYPEAHVVVKNFGRYQERTREDIVSLFSLISGLKA